MPDVYLSTSYICCRYEGPNGGPCVDYDECQDDPCADRCENTVGDYRCVCDTPGWIVDPMDKHLCKRKSSLKRNKNIHTDIFNL